MWHHVGANIDLRAGILSRTASTLVVIVVETHDIVIVDALHTHFRFVCCVEDLSFRFRLLLFRSFTILCSSAIITTILEIAQAISVGWLSILQELHKLIVFKVEMKALM